MPTVITHAVIASAAVYGLGPRPANRRIWFWAIVLAMLPDLDVIGFSLGVDYSDFLGHRGFFHSPLFAILAALAVMLISFRDVPHFSRRWWRIFSIFSIIGASHGITDAMTNGGLGVAFFSPFDNTRHFMPWHPLEVSPIGIRRFFSPWGLKVVISELLWVWLPCFMFVIAAKLVRWRIGKDHGAAGAPTS